MFIIICSYLQCLVYTANLNIQLKLFFRKGFIISVILDIKKPAKSGFFIDSHSFYAAFLRVAREPKVLAFLLNFERFLAFLSTA